MTTMDMHFPSSSSPELPSFNFVIDDSPACHQSLKYWGPKANDISNVAYDIASGFHQFQETGIKHHHAGNRLSELLSNSAKILNSDSLLAEPLSKFGDAFNRIECYRDMLLSQTEMLGVKPMVKMVKDFEKLKKEKLKLSKASEVFHINWEKFASLPHLNNMQDTRQMDKLAHSMINARQRYQLLLANYIDGIRDTNTRQKVIILQRLLEHMFAEFSFYNYCSQILKDLEPYMNTLFDNIQESLIQSERAYTEDEMMKRNLEIEIDQKAQEERHMFPDGGTWSSSTQGTGRFLNKVGGIISGVKKQYHGGLKAEEEQDWEVIDDPNHDKDGGNENILDNTSISGASQFYLPADDNIDGTDPIYISEKVREQGEDHSPNNSSNQDGTVNSIDIPEALVTEEDGRNKVGPEPELPTSKFSAFPFTFKSTYEDEFCKKGYLRIKQKSFPKSKYPLLYFILDKRYGEMLSQGQDQRQPVLFAKLMLSTVRTCDISETDRNYCFQLITSDMEHTLQAKSQKECESWMQAIQDGVAAALDGNQDRHRMNARGKSIYQDKKKTCHNVVERIKAVEGNSFCADCDCPRPGWASTSIGVVFCIECSGIHRGLGVHISKVKSLSLDKWELPLVEFMESKGNKKVNDIYEANLGDTVKINRSSSKSERLEYIVAKYVEKKFMGPSASDKKIEEKAQGQVEENAPDED